MTTPRPRVLLVDDEDAIRENLGSFLERSGFAVSIAANGEVGPRRRSDVVRHKAPGKPQPSSAPGGLR